MQLTKESKILVAVYGVASLFWLAFSFLTNPKDGDLGLYFQIPLAIIPLVGGLFGIYKSLAWGGMASVMGRAMTALSVGLVTWGLGMVVWNYYIFFAKIEVPYPSLADAFFILSWPLWSYGVFELAKAAGAKFGLQSQHGKMTLLFVPIIIAALSYYLLVLVARGGSIDLSTGGLKLFFDLFYPIGDLVILTVTVVAYGLFRKYLGGKYKLPIIILMLGFLLNYFTDFMFSYTTTVESYYNGHFVDLMFLTTMFVLSLGVSQLDSKIVD